MLFHFNNMYCSFRGSYETETTYKPIALFDVSDKIPEIKVRLTVV